MFFSRISALAVLALALSAAAEPNRNRFNTKTKTTSVAAAATQCAAVTKTVTVTAQAAATNNLGAVKTTSRATATTTSRGATASNNVGAGTGNTNRDPQKSLTVDSKVINRAYASPGNSPNGLGLIRSLTSTNNYINFCADFLGVGLTNGQQKEGGSCNGVPQGVIVSPNNAPTIKISLPQNFGKVPASANFTVKMNISKMQTGAFTQPQKTYYMAPAQVNGGGQLIGHTHVTMQKITSFTDTTLLDAAKFDFFKGVNGAAVNGVLTADMGTVTAGFYRICTMNGAANHQPTAMSRINHGSTDDCIYTEVTAAAAAVSPTTAAAATTTSKAAATTSKAANSSGSGRTNFGQGNRFGRPNRGGRRRSFTNRQA